MSVEPEPQSEPRREPCYGCGDPEAEADAVFGWWCAYHRGERSTALPLEVLGRLARPSEAAPMS